MGCDGGTIAGRKDMVATVKRTVTAHSVKEQARGSSNSCALSQESLRAPVVACAMGQLFNKAALLEYLLAKLKYPHFSHIQQLKDVSSVTLHWTPAGQALQDGAKATATNGNGAASELKEGDATAESESLYCCPITGLPSNGVNRFVAMRPCGCVLSERALKSVGGGAAKSSSAAAGVVDVCLVCGKEVCSDSSAPPSPTAAATAAASSTPAAAAASSSTPSPPAATATAAAVAPAAASPFHHPSYLTLFPGNEETLYLRAQLAEKIKKREAEKAAEKLAKKAAKRAAVADGEADGGADGTHKRKADGGSSDAAPPRKKEKLSGAHAALVASRTGNVISDQVRAITAAAAAAVADRKKDTNFAGMFLTEEQIKATTYSAISTKPPSLMSLL